MNTRQTVHALTQYAPGTVLSISHKLSHLTLTQPCEKMLLSTLPALHPPFVDEIIKTQRDDLTGPRPKATGLGSGRTRKLTCLKILDTGSQPKTVTVYSGQVISNSASFHILHLKDHNKQELSKESTEVSGLGAISLNQAGTKGLGLFHTSASQGRICDILSVSSTTL